MKFKYIHALTFLCLTLIVILAQIKTILPDSPGWHSIVYPPKYIIQIISIIVTLIIIVGVYTYLSLKMVPMNLKAFLLHLIMSLPLLIAFIYPFESYDMTSMSKEEFDSLMTKNNII